jgi:hypothetical protein
MFGDPFGDGAFADSAETKIITQNDFLADLFSRRSKFSNSYGENVRFLELHGARIIEPTAFEPDPFTHRGDFYYNAVDNALYRKVKTSKYSAIWNKMH